VPPSFFVCYRREDAGYAAALSRALAERHGPDRVFKDITSLPLAHDWRSEVAAAIGRSTHVLVLIGPNWMAGVDQRGLRDGQPDPIVFELVEASRAGRAVVEHLGTSPSLGHVGERRVHRLRRRRGAQLTRGGGEVLVVDVDRRSAHGGTIAG
jgi:hypothetical protein